MLGKAVEQVNKIKEKHEAAWKQYGCTLMSDGWTDRRGRHLINFLVNSPEGTFFLESVDASSEVHDAPMLADLLQQRIDLIGETRLFKWSLTTVLIISQLASFLWKEFQHCSGPLVQHTVWTSC